MRTIPPILLCLLLCSPAALAFPPCPGEGLAEWPIGDDVPRPDVPAWAIVEYGLAGHDQVLEKLPDPGVPGSGLCRDGSEIGVPEGHHSSGVIGLPGRLAPANGFGVLFLPAMDALAAANSPVEHTLELAFAQTDAVGKDEWIDFVELQLVPAATVPSATPSALYRLRRHYGLSQDRLQVIEVRGPADGSKGAITQRVMASVNLPDGVRTPVGVRWRHTVAANWNDPCAPWVVPGCETFPTDPVETQSLKTPGHMSTLSTRMSEPVSLVPQSPIKTLLEIIGPAGQVLYAVDLSGHRVDMVLIGLIDYSVGKPQSVADTLFDLRLGVRLPTSGPSSDTQ